MDKNKTTSSIYLMHKYWGKKPSNELKDIILKYTDENDLILDPFAGFGGIGIEAMLLNRNVIVNDLNPVANFISDCILDINFNVNRFEELFNKLKESYKDFAKKWYLYDEKEIFTILRTSNNTPIKIRVKNKNKKMEDVILTDKEIKQFIKKENDYRINSWVPNNKLFTNSRICVKENTYIKDLFPKTALICQSYLYELINELEDCCEKKLLKLAFTSNLANCSKLVPPILSRGEMSQGAWMTGFYVGKTYLENNVFHYFENRVEKIKKGKIDYLKRYYDAKHSNNYQITNYDAKKLCIKNESIDFVFTDFPYGDTVPYFEQSQLWNAWLKNVVDYNNEIVVSDSSERSKNIDNFIVDIEKSISEISRVIKDNSYFVFTFHSISGSEWEALVKPLEKYGFEFVDCNSMIQKTFTPRQLNRLNTIKGDILVIYKKKKTKKKSKIYSIEELVNKCIDEKVSRNTYYDTNTIINYLIYYILKYKHKDNSIDFYEILNDNFINNKGKWRLK